MLLQKVNDRGGNEKARGSKGSKPVVSWQPCESIRSVCTLLLLLLQALHRIQRFNAPATEQQQGRPEAARQG
jgi:hypothetical protein